MVEYLFIRKREENYHLIEINYITIQGTRDNSFILAYPYKQKELCWSLVLVAAQRQYRCHIMCSFMLEDNNTLFL